MELGGLFSCTTTKLADRRFRPGRLTARQPPLWYLEDARNAAIKRKGSHDGPTAAGARAGTDQGGREGTAGRVQQSGDDSPQSRGIHAEFYLYFSQRRAGQAAEEHDRQPRPRQAHLSRARREYRAL